MKNWESICSNCGKCCYMHDYDKVNRKAVNATKCPYRDDKKKICTCYENRSIVQPKCGQLTEDMVPFLHKIGVLPDSCEYVKMMNKDTFLKEVFPALIVSENARSMFDHLVIISAVIDKEDDNKCDYDIHFENQNKESYKTISTIYKRNDGTLVFERPVKHFGRDYPYYIDQAIMKILEKYCMDNNINHENIGGGLYIHL